MKKALLLAMVLALVLGAASCSAFKNYDYVNNAVLKTSALDSAKIDVDTRIQVSGEEEKAFSYTVSMKGLQTGTPAWQTETDVTLYGETVPAAVYYEAPYYYAVTENDSVKLESGALIAKTDFVSDWKLACNTIPEEVLKETSEADRGDGTKAAVMSFDANTFTQLYGDLISKWHASLVSEYVGEYSESNLTLSDMTAEIVVNENSGYLVSYGIFCKMDIASKNKAGEDKPISASLSHQIVYHEAGADISVALPDGSADFELTDGLKLDPYKLLTGALEKTKALNDFNADIRIGIAFDMGGFRMDMPVSISLCAKGAHTDAHTFAYTMKTSMLGMEMVQDVYYANGFYYSNDGVYKIKSSANTENEKEYGYQSDIDMILISLPEVLFEGIEVQKNEDGTKTIEIPVDAVGCYPDFTLMINEMLGSTCMWDSGTMTAVINKDGSLRSYDIAFRPTGRMEGILVTYDITYGITYNDIEKIPEAPADLSEYKTIEELNGEVFDIVNNAIANVLDANDLSVVAALESEQRFGSTDTLSIAQEITFAGTQLKTLAPVYRYIATTDTNGYTIIEDAYYKDGYYYIDANIFEEPIKAEESQAPSYNMLEAMSKVIKQVSDSQMQNAEIEGGAGEISYLYLELDGEAFQAMFPELWNASISGYYAPQKFFKSAELSIMADENGKLVSYTLFYDINMLLTPVGGYQNESFYLTETISYMFDTSDAAIIVEPSEAYLTLQ